MSYRSRPLGDCWFSLVEPRRDHPETALTGGLDDLDQHSTSWTSPSTSSTISRRACSAVSCAPGTRGALASVLSTCACGILPYTWGMADKTARLDLRLTAPQKHLIEQAAEISGSTLAGFAISQLVDAASNVVARSRSLVLDAQDWDMFVAALESPDDQAWAELKAMTPVWGS